MASIMLFGGGNNGVQWAMGAKLAQGSAPREQQVSNVNVTSLMLKNDGEHRVARKDSVKVDEVGDGGKVRQSARTTTRTRVSSRAQHEC